MPTLISNYFLINKLNNQCFFYNILWVVGQISLAIIFLQLAHYVAMSRKLALQWMYKLFSSFLNPFKATIIPLKFL
jgi:uncharacterized protein YggT (Ycf19 family)